jgi:bifunctional DNA-binding transcriptional regulator/antitoxin component of YhaV-PrlF toxin-antitoxin module
MEIQFVRSCQYIGHSKAVIVPPEILEAVGIEVGDKVIIRYYEQDEDVQTKNYYRKFINNIQNNVDFDVKKYAPKREEQTRPRKYLSVWKQGE